MHSWIPVRAKSVELICRASITANSEITLGYIREHPILITEKDIHLYLIQFQYNSNKILQNMSFVAMVQHEMMLGGQRGLDNR